MRQWERFAELVPKELYGRSGKVFYSGRSAFSRHTPVYLLGLNPGGMIERQHAETIERDLAEWRARDEDDWSAYADESWEGSKPGSWGMQPRVKHLCQRLGLDIRQVPASNLIFARSNREATLTDAKRLADLCWAFHAAVIETLRPSLVICFGGTAGRRVRARLGAHSQIALYVEKNERRWRSFVHENTVGMRVATLAHPSVAAWNVAATDPSDMLIPYLR